jgi:hypothetical protein
MKTVESVENSQALATSATVDLELARELVAQAMDDYRKAPLKTTVTIPPEKALKVLRPLIVGSHIIRGRNDKTIIAEAIFCSPGAFGKIMEDARQHPHLYASILRHTPERLTGKKDDLEAVRESFPTLISHLDPKLIEELLVKSPDFKNNVNTQTVHANIIEKSLMVARIVSYSIPSNLTETQLVPSAQSFIQSLLEKIDSDYGYKNLRRVKRAEIERLISLNGLLLRTKDALDPSARRVSILDKKKPNPMLAYNEQVAALSACQSVLEPLSLYLTGLNGQVEKLQQSIKEEKAKIAKGVGVLGEDQFSVSTQKVEIWDGQLKKAMEMQEILTKRREFIVRVYKVEIKSAQERFPECIRDLSLRFGISMQEGYKKDLHLMKREPGDHTELLEPAEIWHNTG